MIGMLTQMPVYTRLDVSITHRTCHWSTTLTGGVSLDFESGAMELPALDR